MQMYGTKRVIDFTERHFYITNINLQILRSIRQNFKDLVNNAAVCEAPSSSFVISNSINFQNVANLIDQGRQFLKNYCEQTQGKRLLFWFGASFCLLIFCIYIPKVIVIRLVTKCMKCFNARINFRKVALIQAQWTLRWIVATTRLHNRPDNTVLTFRFLMSCANRTTTSETVSSVTYRLGAMPLTMNTYTPTSLTTVAILLGPAIQTWSAQFKATWTTRDEQASLVIRTKIQTIQIRTIQVQVRIIQARMCQLASCLRSVVVNYRHINFPTTHHPQVQFVEYASIVN